MKKLIVLILLVTLKLTAFSQTDTKIDTDSLTCMSNDVAKLIIKDLLSGDSAKDVLTITQSQLNLTEQKVILKDSVINKLEEKVVNCELIVDTERKKYTILEDHTKKVEVQLKKEKIKNKFQKIVSGGIVVVLSYLLITK
jgi:hypothetical protein